MVLRAIDAVAVSTNWHGSTNDAIATRSPSSSSYHAALCNGRDRHHQHYGVYSQIAIVRQSLAAANDVSGLRRRKLRRFSDAAATSRAGHHPQSRSYNRTWYYWD
jgi:hypothetical protein